MGSFLVHVRLSPLTRENLGTFLLVGYGSFFVILFVVLAGKPSIFFKRYARRYHY